MPSFVVEYVRWLVPRMDFTLRPGTMDRSLSRYHSHLTLTATQINRKCVFSGFDVPHRWATITFYIVRLYNIYLTGRSA